MIIFQDDKEVEIHDREWVLAEDLFLKWGYTPKGDKLEVEDISDVTAELSVWGIPWKWNY